MNIKTRVQHLFPALFFLCLLLSGPVASPVHAGFLGEDDGFLSTIEEGKKRKETPKEEEAKPPSPPSREKATPPARESSSSNQGKKGGEGLGPIVENGAVQPMTALRYLGSFNETIGLSDDQVYMAMGIIKQESWFKIGARNQATTELVNHSGLYDSDACVGLGQLMAVAIQDIIETRMVPMGLIEADPDMRDDFSILRENIVPGTYNGKTIYRYAKKAVIVLVTNPKLSLVLSATYIKRTENLLKDPGLTGRWYNALAGPQQLKAVPMSYNAGIGRSLDALNRTHGEKIVENVARNLTGGADKMYYAKVTKFAEKFKEMKVYDVAVSLNKAVGLRALTESEKKGFASAKKPPPAAKLSKSMKKEEAIAQYLNLERNMSVFLTFEDDQTGNENFIGTWTMNDEEMKDFRKGLFE